MQGQRRRKHVFVFVFFYKVVDAATSLSSPGGSWWLSPVQQGEERVEDKCVSSLREAMRGLRWG